MDKYSPKTSEIGPGPFSPEEIRALSLPAIVVVSLALLWILYQSIQLFNASQEGHGGLLLVLVFLSISYIVFQHHFLDYQIPKRPWLMYALAGLHGILLPLLSPLIPQYAELLYYVVSATTLVFIAITFGRWPTYLFLTTNVLTTIAWFYPRVHPPYPAQLYFMQLAFVSYGIAETALYARSMLVHRIQNLRVLNRVARALAMSIDRDRVIALVKEAIQQALQADTYFIALLEGDDLRLELLYDDGEFFPPTTIPQRGGLGGWVLEHRQTLRISNLPQELPALGIQRRVVGKQKVNLSWMGTPLESGGYLLGLVAVGSYRINAFSQEDQELLENIAQQAALALDNAFHHAEVEEQARRDSLTGAYNHGYFIRRLHELCATAQHNHTPLSLIMLDVDYFKNYNDTYGHMVGDEVLRTLVQIIRRHIKHTDVVGRWGGEEFAIALPNATLPQALIVAERIRTTMANFKLLDRDGQPIPAPTVSQGVAEFPAERDEPYALIDLADQRLYHAKEHGRNQIFPPPPSEKDQHTSQSG